MQIIYTDKIYNSNERTWTVTQDCFITYSLVSHVSNSNYTANSAIYKNGSKINEAPLPYLAYGIRNECGYFYAHDGDIIKIACSVSDLDGSKSNATASFSASIVNTSL